MLRLGKMTRWIIKVFIRGGRSGCSASGAASSFCKSRILLLYLQVADDLVAGTVVPLFLFKVQPQLSYYVEGASTPKWTIPVAIGIRQPH